MGSELNHNLNAQYVPNSVKEALTLICDISYDYDGYADSQNLKELVDEISWYASCALRMMASNSD